MLKAPGVELCQNACGVVNEQKIFCSHQCFPECSMNKFRAYISKRVRTEQNTSAEHCGTSHVSVDLLDLKLLIDTYCLLFSISNTSYTIKVKFTK